MRFNLIDFFSLSPLFILFSGILLLLLIKSFAKNLEKTTSFAIAFFIILAALIVSAFSPPSENSLLTPWLRFDPLARFFTIFFLSIGLSTSLLSHTFFQRQSEMQSEYYFLLLTSLSGLILIGSSADFLTLFLGIETLSLSLYVLCGYRKTSLASQESALKYFFMGSIAAAFLLYGVALLYGATGTTHFDALLGSYKSSPTPHTQTLFYGGIALVILSLAFEAAIVPFHIWAPDVYAGAPTPVTGFMAVGTKVGAFAAFIRVYFDALSQFRGLWNEGIALLAYPTLIYANFVALQQTHLRRFFAYSGISHAGYLLIALAVGTPEALDALLFYLVVYSIATIGCFAVLGYIDTQSENISLNELRGLFSRSPLLTLVFSLCLLTLAGMPPTAGFFAKFYLFKVAFQAHYYALVVVALLTTVLSAFYYLRIVGIMFTETKEPYVTTRYTRAVTFLGVLAFISLALLSLYPAPLLAFLQHGFRK